MYGSRQAKILIVYATTEGHTRKIAMTVGDWLTEMGLGIKLVDADKVPLGLEPFHYDAFVLAGSLHETKHQKSLEHFVEQNRIALQSKPSCFLSASLTAINVDGEHQEAARKCISKFCEETGWTPTESLPVAGALQYTKYSCLKRLLMMMIVRSEGGDTDTSRDYEYTDWEALHTFVADFARAHVQTETMRIAVAV